MKHEMVVTEVPLAELTKVLSQRWAARWNERYPNGLPVYGDDGALVSMKGQPTKAEHEAGVKELVDGYRAEGLTEDSAWSATCKCGWEANNPLPTKQAAEVDAESHLESVYGGDR